MFLFRKIIFALCIVHLVMPMAAWGDEPLTLDQAVVEALQENPALKAKEANANAAKAQIGVAKSLDDPMVGVEFYQVPLNTVAVDQAMDINYSVIQKFPFPGKRGAKKKAAESEFRSELSGYDAKKLATQVQTEHAFHELYLADKSLKLIRELKILFANLAASEGARYTTEKKTSQDFLKSKSEKERLESEAALLDAERSKAEAMLNILRHKNPNEPVAIADLPRHEHPFPNYEAFEEQVLKRHPELKMAQNKLAASESNTSFAKREASLPDIQIRGTYVQRFGQIDAWTAEAMINIPFLWEKNRKSLEEARAKEHQAKQELLSQQDQRLAALKEAYARFESNKKSYAIYKTKVLPNLSIAMKAAQSAYETGNTSFIDFIDTAREYKKAQLETLKAFVDYHSAISDLKYAVGEDFMPALMRHP